MFRRRTLLIVGAGASKEVGLPTGPELADKISRLLRFKSEFGNLTDCDRDFFQRLRQHDPGGYAQALQAARQISENVKLVSSIDNYIDTHRHDAQIAFCGKAAIAYSILNAERRSPLFAEHDPEQPTLRWETVAETWYPALGRILTDRVPFSEREKVFDNLTIICFNYDRCIEEFLSRWLARVYSIDLRQAAAIVDKLPIFRPYGSVGVGPNRLAFGADPARFQFCNLASGIRTYTEQVDDPEVLQGIRQAVAKAETIVFLGFGFHSQNLELIAPTGAPCARRIFASAYGFSEPDQTDIAYSLRGLFSNPRAADPTVHVTPLKCAGLFNEFKRSLVK